MEEVMGGCQRLVKSKCTNVFLLPTVPVGHLHHRKHDLYMENFLGAPRYLAVLHVFIAVFLEDLLHNVRRDWDEAHLPTAIFLPFLMMGVTSVLFQTPGTFPDCYNRSKILESCLAMPQANSFTPSIASLPVSWSCLWHTSDLSEDCLCLPLLWDLLHSCWLLGGSGTWKVWGKASPSYQRKARYKKGFEYLSLSHVPCH